MLLVIKGYTFEAIAACNARGITVAGVVSCRGPETFLLVDEANCATVGRWFAEYSRLDPGNGFPAGTLLYFRHGGGE